MRPVITSNGVGKIAQPVRKERTGYVSSEPKLCILEHAQCLVYGTSAPLLFLLPSLVNVGIKGRTNHIVEDDRKAIETVPMN